MELWELTAREAVRQRLADYTAGTDAFSLPAMAACFAPDGVLTFTGGEPLVGPDAIVAGLSSRVSGGAVSPTHVRHHVSSLRFDDVQPDRVAVSSYFTVFTDVGVDHWGRYRDVLNPLGDQWLIASRKIAVDGFSASSLMRPQE